MSWHLSPNEYNKLEERFCQYLSDVSPLYSHYRHRRLIDTLPHMSLPVALIFSSKQTPISLVGHIYPEPAGEVEPVLIQKLPHLIVKSDPQ